MFKANNLVNILLFKTSLLPANKGGCEIYTECVKYNFKECSETFSILFLKTIRYPPKQNKNSFFSIYTNSVFITNKESPLTKTYLIHYASNLVGLHGLHGACMD